jgi:ABC-type transporter Mla subunit MlaD
VIRRLAAVATILVACAAAVVLTGGKEEVGKRTIKIPFDNAFGLTKGGDVRVGGVKAGATTNFGVSKGPECQSKKNKAQGPRRTCAVVEVQITEPGFESFRADASCDIRQQSLIGEYFVDCQPGSSKEDLKDNIVPIDQTTSTIPADLVLNVMRRPYRERLRLLIAELGTGLAGRPQDLANVLQKAHPGLRETARTLAILEKQTNTIKNFISDSDAVVAQLEARKKDVARWIDSAEHISRISASRRSEIAAGFRRLPRFLDELDPTMQRLGELTDAQTPLLADLQRSAPGLNTFFTRLGPFAEASRPAFRSLGASSDKGLRAVRASSDEINELRRLAENAPRLGKPLRQLLQTADDRTRGRPDTRAAATATPNTKDPTSIARSKRTAFTAMESVWNYVFWQTLSINEFDSISHQLRVLLIMGSECAPYANAEMAKQKARQEHCNSWLGPYQPGVNAKDPTEDGGNSAKATKEGKGEKQRGAGDPEALPTPGKPDISKPQVALPPGLQDVQNDARNQTQGQPAPSAGGSAGETAQPAPDQLLDFLLAP